MNEIKLPLRRAGDGPLVASRWTRCLPFVQNKRGVLTHRPVTVTVYKLHRRAHLAVHYWCANAATGTDNFTFLAKAPEDALICAKCEAAAVLAGFPSTDSLCGYHVHKGRVIPEQTCCIALDTTK